MVTEMRAADVLDADHMPAAVCRGFERGQRKMRRSRGNVLGADRLAQKTDSNATEGIGWDR